MNQLNLFNALTQTLEPFIPPNPHDVKIYCCGPTMYAAPHLGHARTYVFMDVLRRILQHYLGYGVRLVMNVTNLDDKITAAGGLQIARHYENQFFKTMELLNVQKPDFTPRGTECLELASNLWKRCMTEKFAYFTQNLDVYFHTKAYLKKFGRSFPNMDNRKQAVPIEGFEEGKWASCDFALWKESKSWIDDEGNKHTGMPGRHVECASMAIFHFHDFIDIQLGGIDLQFPHHEHEIALARVYFDKKEWVRFCVYTGHLKIEGRKMSNSLKNVTSVEEMVAKGYSPLAIRYMFLKYPYNRSMHFREDELKRAQQSYDKFMQNIKKMKAHLFHLAYQDTIEELYDSWKNTDELNNYKKIIDNFLMDNVNIPKALENLEKYVELAPLKLQNTSYQWMCYCLHQVLFLTDTCFGLIAQH